MQGLSFPKSFSSLQWCRTWLVQYKYFFLFNNENKYNDKSNSNMYKNMLIREGKNHVYKIIAFQYQVWYIEQVLMELQ